MPVIRPERQSEHHTAHPPGLDWFGGGAGGRLLADEAGAVARVLDACPALPRVWFGVAAAGLPAVGGRGLALRREGEHWNGSVRCGLPLPLASESVGAVLLQHVLDDHRDIDALLGECARVLAPGGTLWLAVLNPWTPYRLRWAGSGLRARDPGYWQAAVRRAGLSGEAVSLQWIGPHWRDEPRRDGLERGGAGIGAADRLRAAVALTVNKRVRALLPPARVVRLPWRPARPGVAQPLPTRAAEHR